MIFFKNLFSLFNNRNEKLDIIISQNKRLIEIKEQDTTTNNNHTKPISGFELFNLNREEVIKFDSISEEELKSYLPQIPLTKHNQDNISGILSSITGGAANVALTSSATYGLFKATANPETLMKLSSGGVGSAVVEGGKISQQAGFIQVGSSIFTPMLVFQLTSIVTGQYYMNNITKQLNAVQEKLDELLQQFHIERQAKLIRSFQFLKEYLNKTNFVLEDFVLIKSIMSDVTDIREEYFLMLESSFESIRKNNRYSSLNSLKEAKKIALEFEKKGFLFKMKTSLIADELYHLAKVTEFHMNLCFKDPDINRINLIADKLKNISNVSYSNISFTKTSEMYSTIKEDTIYWLEYSKNESWFNSSEISEISNGIQNQFNEFEKEKKEKLNSIINIYQNVKEPFLKEKQIFIDNRNGNPQLYLT
ncbi:hypothetical protein [Tenacibaculum sp.]|uniref:hypothetical protein n=1 Tax=Tenacibaculum sp. TaxID=1906242 RepID=UPI003AA8B12F